MKRRQQPWVLLLASALLGACAVPSPYQKPTPPPEQPSGTPPAETRPGEPPSTTEEPQPLPAPVAREPTLGAASRALVSQAQTQVATKNYAIAASSIERALRIEPDNPLLWIELGHVHLAQGNAPQAEGMGRKAVALSVGDPSAQSSAWRLIGDALRTRGRTLDATEAYQKANQATPR